jgi:GGDEF domain-containing protein
MADDSLEQPTPVAVEAPPLLLATPGPAERLARLLDLGEVREVTRGDQVLAAAQSGQADAAVVGERLEDLSALDLGRALRAGHAGADLPLIIVAERFSDPAEEQALEAGADDFVDPAQMGARLLRRLRARLRLAWRRQESNPLTGLPGAGALERELVRRLPDRGRLAVVAFDLRHFKAFNDRYGYARGDDLLRLLRDTLLAALREQGTAADFVAHLGGDDFFLVTEPERMRLLAEGTQEKFDDLAAGLYDRRDREAGGLRVVMRTGEERLVPLTRLIAVAVTNVADEVRHPGQIAAILAELKEYARRTEKTGLFQDRRRSYNAGRTPREGKGE